jgi:hypothetical protein
MKAVNKNLPEVWFDKHGEPKLCDKCHAPLHWDMLTDSIHDDNLCVGRQLTQAKAEIKKLKASVEDWRDSWFQLRDIIGRLWWHHPALSSEESLKYYQDNLKRLAEQSTRTE